MSNDQISSGWNPFFRRGPIRRRQNFFGRQRETRQALSLLQNGQSLSVVGPRSIGKSSLLLHLADKEVQQAYGMSPARFVFIYLGCAGWDDLPADDLCKNLLERLQDTLTGSQRDRLPMAGEDGAGGCRMLRDAVRNAGDRGLQLVFLMDDFGDLARNGSLDASFFSALVGLADGGQTAFVTTSRNELTALPYANPDVLTSPFFHTMAQIRLPVFDEATARELLSVNAEAAGSSFSAAEIDFLVQLADSHPLLVQMAGYHALEEGLVAGRTPESGWRERVRAAFAGEAEAHLTYLWQTLSPRQQSLLAMLPLAWRADPEGVRSLLQEALLVVRDGYPQLPSEAFAQFVSRQHVPGLVQVPPVSLDPTGGNVLLRGKPLALSPSEFDLLTVLVENAGQIVPRQQLEHYLWPDEQELTSEPERLRAVVKTLRRALGPDCDLIENVRGRGYRFARLAS